MRAAVNVLAALAALAASATACSIPQCSVMAELSAPKTAVAGRKFTTSATIKNTGATALDNFYFQLQLPDYLLPLAARGSAYATKGAPAPLLEAPYVRFRGIRLPAHKTLRLKMTVGVPTCQATGSVQLEGVAYRLDGDGSIACLSTVAPVSTTVAHKKVARNAKHAIQGNCTASPTPPAPPAPGGDPYSVAPDTLCVQAEPLNPFDSTRALTVVEEGRGRRLMPTASPAELQCWTCCGEHLNATGPYYFNMDAEGGCYCCAECDPLYSPTFTAYGSAGRPVWHRFPDSNSNAAYQVIGGAADGSMLLAATSSKLVRSTDGGNSWAIVQDLGANALPFGLRCNAEGTICMISTQYQPGYTAGTLYRSTDGGATWSAVSGTNLGRWGGLWCNAAGTVWIAALSSAGFGRWGALYKSTDSGLSFSLISGTDQDIGRWEFVECDNSGMKCVFGGNTNPNSVGGAGTRPYTTNDGFLTLNEVTDVSYGVFFGGAVSNNGSKMFITQSEDFGFDNLGNDVGLIYYSDDGGATFTTTDAPRRYYSKAFCDSEFKMCAAAANGDINYNPVLSVNSCEGGRTWFESQPAKGWSSVFVAADGGTMYAVDDTFQQTKYVWSFPLAVV